MRRIQRHYVLYSQRADTDTLKRARRQGFIKEKPEDLSIYHEEYIKEKYSGYDLMLYDAETSDMIDYDMYLIASCKHMILANSGFSWWAAYLHDKELF